MAGTCKHGNEFSHLKKGHFLTNCTVSFKGFCNMELVTKDSTIKPDLTVAKYSEKIPSCEISAGKNKLYGVFASHFSVKT